MSDQGIGSAGDYSSEIERLEAQLQSSREEAERLAEVLKRIDTWAFDAPELRQMARMALSTYTANKGK